MERDRSGRQENMAGLTSSRSWTNSEKQEQPRSREQLIGEMSVELRKTEVERNQRTVCTSSHHVSTILRLRCLR